MQNFNINLLNQFLRTPVIITMSKLYARTHQMSLRTSLSHNPLILSFIIPRIATFPLYIDMKLQFDEIISYVMILNNQDLPFYLNQTNSRTKRYSSMVTKPNQ